MLDATLQPDLKMGVAQVFWDWKPVLASCCRSTKLHQVHDDFFPSLESAKTSICAHASTLIVDTPQHMEYPLLSHCKLRVESNACAGHADGPPDADHNFDSWHSVLRALGHPESVSLLLRLPSDWCICSSSCSQFLPVFAVHAVASMALPLQE